MENLDILYIDEKPYVDIDSLISLLGTYHAQLNEMSDDQQIQIYGSVAGFVESFAAALTNSLIKEE